jgi:electron transport complex protein RnfG
MKLALGLFSIAAITTVLLDLTYSVTSEPIERQRIRTQEKMMKEVLTQADHFEEMEAKTSGSIVRVFEATNDGKTIGYVVELSPSGYSGNINMIVGISRADNVLTGMRVLKHTETPGLGALATAEKFYRKYEGKKLVPLKVVKASPREDEIDAITSATITTRAITDAVNEAIKWYKESDLSELL